MRTHLFKLYYSLCMIGMVLISSCSSLEDRLSALEDRVENLEALCERTNENIESIKIIIDAMENRDYITEVNQITEDGEVIGYTIEFAESESITIYNGVSPDSPDISVVEDEGNYYWMLNGEYLTDSEGNRIPATGNPPEFKITDGRWMLSVDGGVTWEDYGQATGDAFFSDVEITDSEVTFILSNGQSFTVSRASELDIQFDEDALVVMDANSSRSVGYSIISSSADIDIEVMSSSDIKAKITKSDALTGTIDIVTGSVIDEYSKIMVFVSDGRQVIMRSFAFEEAGLIVSDSSIKEISSEGGTVELEFMSNIDCEVEIPQDAASWISAVNTKAMAPQSIILQIAENPAERREAEVLVRAEGSELFLRYTIVQHDNMEFLSNRDKEITLELLKYFEMDYLVEYLKDKPFNEWGKWDPHVDINSEGRLTKIQFSGLYGHEYDLEVPDEIALLSELEYLAISSLNIKVIPDCIGALKKLKYLSFTNNDVETVSDSLACCESLEELYLTNNKLKNIPNAIFKLPNLRILRLNRNIMNTELPDNIGMLSELEELNMQGCCLTGEIPSAIGGMSSLRVLNLSSGPNDFTKFTCGIPEELGKCTNLEELYLYNVGLTGEIPQSFGNLRKLTSLNLSRNQLSGDIPEDVTYLPVWKSSGWSIIWQEVNGPAMTFNPKTLNLAFPDFNTVDLVSGRQVTDEDILQQNKLTVVYTYYDLKSVLEDQVKDLYNKYYDQGLGFLNLAMSSDITSYDISQIEMPLACNVLSSETSASVSVSPAAYLFDSEGNYIDMMFIDYRNEEFQKSIESVLGGGNGSEIYTSSDYSMDGEVVTYQKATIGVGIDLVFMGDAFVDKDMAAGGAYEQAMDYMIEDFFSYEPYKSMRDRFNIYAVKVVSPNSVNTVGAVHRIENDPAVCIEYAQKIPDLNQDRMMVTVYVNCPGGLSYTSMLSDGSFFAFIKNKENGVVAHEAGGHGFAGLLDEYVNYSTESATESDRQYLDDIWSQYGWGANVDWRNDSLSVKWSRFLSDDRYSDEGVGLYEGAYLIGYGVYRATERSMMNRNDSPFNAPSREQIYKRIMQYSEGSGWQYDYDEFVDFDKSVKESPAITVMSHRSSGTESSNEQKEPNMIVGTWRDFIK